MRARVLILGPAPGTAGGIGVLMRHIADTESRRTVLSFVDAGATGSKRTLKFLRSAAFLVMNRKNFDVAHVNVASRGSTVRKLLLTSVLQICRKPYVLQLHGGGYETFYSGLGGFPRFLVRKMFARAAKILVLGSHWQEFVRSQLCISEVKIAVVPNGVPGPQSLDIKPIKNGVLFAGRLSAAKGVPDLVQAARLIDPELDWSLVLAGDCLDAGILASLDDPDLPIVWHGWVDSCRLSSLMLEAEMFVLPSHAEGLPLALLDAMAHGALPIVTPVGSVPEVVVNGENGIIVPVGDPVALANAIQLAISDPEWTAELRSNARATWERTYSIEKLRTDLDLIYWEILDKVDVRIDTD